MGSEKACAPGHYGALGVQPSASPRQIEMAFHAWGDRLAKGVESVAAYRRAESAYHILATPDSRSRHDRQLGLLSHPAWAAGRDRAARACVRLALRELGRASPDRARLLLDRAVSLDPQEPHARSYLALALARTGGSLHEAVRHGRYAIERRPREAAFFFNLAEVYSAAGLRTRAFATRARGWQALAAAVLRRHRLL
jgi:tetratricopeptide (TPR) repeat protein